MAPRFQPRHQYDSETEDFYGELAATTNDEPSLTNQHFAKDADINEIMHRFGVTDGAIQPVAMDPKFFGDFSDVPDFRDALDTTRQAADRFNALPADIRARFRNDPVELWQFVTNPANLEEAIKLGLLHREAKPPAPPQPLSAPPATT